MSAVACLCLAGAALPGCSKEYGQSRLANQSPEARQIQGMLDALRAGGAGKLDETLARDGATGMDPTQQQALRATLTALIQARDVQIKQADSFGADVYRAIFTLTDPAGATKDFPVLLVRADGKFRWAGRS